MHLRYTSAKDGVVQFELGEEQVVIGRSEEADVMIDDDEASRLHAAVILWDEDYVIKDLKTANGTHVNDKKIDVALLAPGSVIRIGQCDIIFEDKMPTSVGRGPNTVLRKVNREMEDGKGYKTIMKEIIHDVDTKTKE